MAYVLEALLCGDDVELGDPPRLVPLRSGVVMVPLTAGNRSWIREASPATTEGSVLGFEDLDDSTRRFAQRLSEQGPVVYVHAEFHAGTGFQAAVGWDSAKIRFGPRFTANHEIEQLTDDYEIVPAHDQAVNQALRFLGVPRGAEDEFDTVGLGEHRSTNDW